MSKFGVMLQEKIFQEKFFYYNTYTQRRGVQREVHTLILEIIIKKCLEKLIISQNFQQIRNKNNEFR